MGLTRVKNIFFEVTNFLEIFCGEAEIACTGYIDCLRYEVEQYHTFFRDFEVIMVFLGPFLGIERRKWAKKVETDRVMPKTLSPQNTYEFWLSFRKKISAVRQKVIEISQKTFGGFFCPLTVRRQLVLK